MSLVPLSMPPGVYANGTDSQARGRYRDCNLVRWFEGALRPMGGWTLYSAGSVDGCARAIITWVDSESVLWCAIGTHTGLHAMGRLGNLHDITPEDFTAGEERGVTGGGYGSGFYGGGLYGEHVVDEDLIRDAAVWSLDTFGENLVATHSPRGKLYKWSRETGDPAETIAGAPDHNRALVVTEEGFIFALGAGDEPRVVQWCDQQNDSVWTPGPDNQAGSFPLQTTGRLMCGKRIRGGTLLFTDQDVHLATYQGAPLVYGFQRVGTGCGVISQGAAIVGGDAAVAWMGLSGFWTYDGFAKPLPCEVSDRVFGDLNRNQASLITGFYSASFGEMTWLYPSANALENDRYVRYNHREGHWAVGSLNRSCGVQEGVFPHPLLAEIYKEEGVPRSRIFAHEFEWDYGGAEPWAETGPIEIGNGDGVFTALALIPDERTLGAVRASFYTRFQPMGPESVHGPYTPAEKTDVRFTARQARMRLTGASPPGDWRAGPFRLDVTLRGPR